MPKLSFKFSAAVFVLAFLSHGTAYAQSSTPIYLDPQQPAHNGYDHVLLIGHAPHADQTWVSTLLAIRLPLFPRLKVRLATQFTLELVRSVLANELHMALVTAPPVDGKLTIVPFAETQLGVVVPETHAAAHQQQVKLEDLADDELDSFSTQSQRSNLRRLKGNRGKSGSSHKANA